MPAVLDHLVAPRSRDAIVEAVRVGAVLQAVGVVVLAVEAAAPMLVLFFAAATVLHLATLLDAPVFGAVWVLAVSEAISVVVLLIEAFSFGLSLRILVHVPPAAGALAGGRTGLFVGFALQCTGLASTRVAKCQGTDALFLVAALRLAPLLDARVFQAVLVLAIAFAITIIVLAIEALATSLCSGALVMVPAAAACRPGEVTADTAVAEVVVGGVDVRTLAAGCFALLAAALDTVAVGRYRAPLGHVLVLRAVRIFAVGETISVVVAAVEALDQRLCFCIFIMPPAAAARFSPGHARIENSRPFVRARNFLTAAVFALILDADAIFLTRFRLLTSRGGPFILEAVGVVAVCFAVTVIILMVEAFTSSLSVGIFVMKPSAQGFFFLAARQTCT